MLSSIFFTLCLVEGDHLIDQTILTSFLSAFPVISLGVCADGLIILAGVLSQHTVQLLLGAEDMLCCDLDLGSLTLRSTQRLMNHDLCIRQCKTLALGTTC